MRMQISHLNLNRRSLSVGPTTLCPTLPTTIKLEDAPLSPPSIPSYENEPPTQILPFLYVGNERDAKDPELLRRLGIRYVLSVTNDGITHSNGTEKLAEISNNKVSTLNASISTAIASTASISTGIASNASTTATSQPVSHQLPTIPLTNTPTTTSSEFRTKLIPVSDNLLANLAPYFEEASDFIEEARKSGSRVLIHCHAGISRSPTIAIAYIMKHIHLSTLEAYAFVQKVRRIISPNLNFMGQLVEYESKLKKNGPTSPSTQPIIKEENDQL